MVYTVRLKALSVKDETFLSGKQRRQILYRERDHRSRSTKILRFYCALLYSALVCLGLKNMVSVLFLKSFLASLYVSGARVTCRLKINRPLTSLIPQTF